MTVRAHIVAAPAERLAADRLARANPQVRWLEAPDAASVVVVLIGAGTADDEEITTLLARAVRLDPKPGLIGLQVGGPFAVPAVLSEYGAEVLALGDATDPDDVDLAIALALGRARQGRRIAASTPGESDGCNREDQETVRASWASAGASSGSSHFGG